MGLCLEILLRNHNNDVVDVSLENDVTVACVFVSEDQFENERCPLLMNVRCEGIAYTILI